MDILEYEAIYEYVVKYFFFCKEQVIICSRSRMVNTIRNSLF